MKNILIHQGSYQGKPVGNTSMAHIKHLEVEPSHRVVTVEDIEEDKEEKFRGSKRACQSFINNSNLITLTIEEI